MMMTSGLTAPIATAGGMKSDGQEAKDRVDRLWTRMSALRQAPTALWTDMPPLRPICRSGEREQPSPPCGAPRPGADRAREPRSARGAASAEAWPTKYRLECRNSFKYPRRKISKVKFMNDLILAGTRKQFLNQVAKAQECEMI